MPHCQLFHRSIVPSSPHHTDAPLPAVPSSPCHTGWDLWHQAHSMCQLFCCSPPCTRGPISTWKSSVTMISHGAAEAVEVQESIPLSGMPSAQLTTLCWLPRPDFRVLLCVLRWRNDWNGRVCLGDGSNKPAILKAPAPSLSLLL